MLKNKKINQKLFVFLSSLLKRKKLYPSHIPHFQNILHFLYLNNKSLFRSFVTLLKNYPPVFHNENHHRSLRTPTMLPSYPIDEFEQFHPSIQKNFLAHFSSLYPKLEGSELISRLIQDKILF